MIGVLNGSRGARLRYSENPWTPFLFARGWANLHIIGTGEMLSNLFGGICRFGPATFYETSRNSPGEGSFDLPGIFLVSNLSDSGGFVAKFGASVTLDACACHSP